MTYAHSLLRQNKSHHQDDHQPEEKAPLIIICGNIVAIK